MGELRSQLGASGFEMDSGSSLSLLGESAEEIQYDANIVSQNAAMAAWGHQVGATRAANDVSWQNFQKKQAGSGKGALFTSIGGSLLGSLGDGITKFNQTKP